MPLLIFSYALRLCCAVHAMRRGYPIALVLLILTLPVIGALVYVFAVLLPEIRKSRAAAEAKDALHDAIDPGRKLRARAQDLEMSDTVQNRVGLAEEFAAKGEFRNAALLYRSCLEGVYADDPEIMMKLAHTLYVGDEPAECAAVLETLVAKNPDFRSQEGHLLYARALEDKGEFAAAIKEYAAVAGYFSGAEAKYRYARLLKRQGSPDAAHRLFQEIVTLAERSAPHYRKLQQEWIAGARRELS